MNTTSTEDWMGYICPPCKIFYPTPEEFKDPLKYIASIRPQAELTGICKIVPPQGWRPPFAVNENKFKFRTRLQPLNCIEGNARQEGIFLESLRMFLYQNGHPMHEIPSIDDKTVCLSDLFEAVQQRGGFEKIANADEWFHIAKMLNLTTEVETNVDTATKLQDIYQEFLHAYELAQQQPAPPASAIKTANQVESQQHGAAQPGKRGRGRPRKQDQILNDTPLTSPQKSSSGGDQPSPTQSNQVTPSKLLPGLLKRGRGRPTKQQSNVIRMLVTEAPEPCDPSLLEPSALAADPNRTCRIEPPLVRVGQKYYRSNKGDPPLLGEVKKVVGGKKPSVHVEYEGGYKDILPYGTMQVVLANGSDKLSALQALDNEICQSCLRGDCPDKVVICERCSSGYHYFCIPLGEIPPGDWYCASCLEEEAMESSKGERVPPMAMKFGFEMGPEYTLATFKAKADKWKQEYFEGGPIPSGAELEREYWRLLNSPTQKIQVEYGSDVDTGAMGSGFPTIEKIKKIRQRLLERLESVRNPSSDILPSELELRKLLIDENTSGSQWNSMDSLEMYAQSPWNLTNLPKLNGSLLQFLDEDIKGVMVPWMYVGMCFSTFCWHVEDHNFYSISYLHRGAPKTWYGVPGHAAAKMEQVMRELTPRLFGNQPDLHFQLVTMFSPETLRKHGVPVFRATHQPNEFIVTYPSSYHGGFNNGFNLAEAVNFATPDWISWGAIAVNNYKKFHKIPVFSHDALLVTMTLAALDNKDTLNAQHIRNYLLPALRQLYHETLAFWTKVSEECGITRSENMESYLESQGRSLISRASARESRMSRMEKEENTETTSRPKKKMRMQASKMSKMNSAPSMKMNVGSNSRVSRQVQWAGKLGKYQGLRCSTCEQYCFVAAVVCVKCRVFGCIDHMNHMCKCDLKISGCWLYHMDTHQLKQSIETLERKLEFIDKWESQLEQIQTLDDLDRLIQTGESMQKQQVGVSKPRLLSLKTIWLRLKHFDDLLSRKMDIKQSRGNLHSSATMFELNQLIQDANQVPIHISLLDRLQQVQKNIMQCQRRIHEIARDVSKMKINHAKSTIINEPVISSASHSLDTDITGQNADISMKSSNGNENQLSMHSAAAETLSMMNESKSAMSESTYPSQLDNNGQSKKRMFLSEVANAMEEGSSTSVNTQTELEISHLKNENKQLSLLMQEIKEIMETISVIAIPERSAFCNDVAYINWIYDVNLVILKSYSNQTHGSIYDIGNTSWKGSSSASGLFPTQMDVESLYNNPARQLIPFGWKAHSLNSLMQFCKLKGNENISIWERVQSIEELEENLKKIVNYPVYPTIVAQMYQRWKHTKEWSHNLQILNESQKITLQQALNYERQANELVIPTNFLLRRQLNGHLHDSNRWIARLHGLFGLPTSRSTFSLQNILERNVASDMPNQLICVCRQVYDAAQQLLQCWGCSTWYHTQCIGLDANAFQTNRFLCQNCCLNKRKPYPYEYYRSAKLFCLCRQSIDNIPMICCDFCDEWYHAKCIGMTPYQLSTLEAYRCKSCTVRLGMGHKVFKQCASKPLFHQVKEMYNRGKALRVEPPELLELESLVILGQDLLDDLSTFESDLLQEGSLQRIMKQVDAIQNQVDVKSKALQDIESLVTFDIGRQKLRRIQWCLNACKLIFNSTPAPRYSQLLILLNDAKDDKLAFTSPDFQRFHEEIERNLNRAKSWVNQMKTLGPISLASARKQQLYDLKMEAEEISQFLCPPEQAMSALHQACHEAGITSA